MFAARKGSRHQLHKHVYSRVYLGVWRITLNSVQAVVGIHMTMSITVLRGTRRAQGRRLTRHAHSRYTRYALDTRYHDYMS